MLRRRTLHAALGLLALSSLLAACATTPAPAPIPETAAAQAQHSTFTALVQQAGLADTLRGAGPFTVFAPSDEAFKALPAATLASLRANPAQLKDVLSLHVVAAQLPAEAIKNGPAKSLQGANLALAKAGDFVTVEDAMVQQANLAASNGVVHVIDRVLLPAKK